MKLYQTVSNSGVADALCGSLSWIAQIETAETFIKQAPLIMKLTATAGPSCLPLLSHSLSHSVSSTDSRWKLKGQWSLIRMPRSKALLQVENILIFLMLWDRRSERQREKRARLEWQKKKEVWWKNSRSNIIAQCQSIRVWTLQTHTHGYD